MGTKQGSVWIVVIPYGSKNRDQFLRFGRFLFVSAFLVNFGQYSGMKLWSNLEEMKEHEEEQRSEGDLIGKKK